MESGISIALGGEKVFPSDCNYSSYSELKLICQSCKNPIFLVAPSSVRSHVRKGKPISGFTRKDHFSHFFEKDRLQECEHRSDLSPAERESLASSARNQRLKVFISSIYEILELSPPLVDLKLIPRLVNSLLTETLGNEIKANSAYRIVGKSFWVYLKTNQNELKTLIEGSRLHTKIATEAFSFLVSSSGVGIASTLFWHSYYYANQISVLESMAKIAQYTQANFVPIFEDASLDTLTYINQAPWIQGFSIKQKKYD